jgi:hypothetical protein
MGIGRLGLVVFSMVMLMGTMVTMAVSVMRMPMRIMAVSVRRRACDMNVGTQLTGESVRGRAMRASKRIAHHQAWNQENGCESVHVENPIRSNVIHEEQFG